MSIRIVDTAASIAQIEHQQAWEKSVKALEKLGETVSEDWQDVKVILLTYKGRS